MRSSNRRAASAALVVAVLFLQSAHTQDGAPEDEPLDRTPKRCLSMGTIDDTLTIDDRTLLFFVRGDRVYRNSLPQICPGLLPNKSIAYRSSGGRLAQLCESAMFSVEDMPGLSCKLGPFVPVSAEEAEQLRSRR